MGRPLGLDLAEQGVSFKKLTKCYVLFIKKRRIASRDEKLRSVRVGSIVRHRYHTCSELAELRRTSLVMAVLEGLVREELSFMVGVPSPCILQYIAALCDKSRYNPVEDSILV